MRTNVCCRKIGGQEEREGRNCHYISSPLAQYFGRNRARVKALLSTRYCYSKVNLMLLYIKRACC